MTRDEVIERCLAANDKEAAQAALKAVEAWMKEHPDDMHVLWAGDAPANLLDELTNS